MDYLKDEVRMTLGFQNYVCPNASYVNIFRHPGSWCYVDFQLFKLPVSFICIVKETFILLFYYLYMWGVCVYVFFHGNQSNNLPGVVVTPGCELPGVGDGNKTRGS